jgi:hypothetical protein
LVFCFVTLLLVSVYADLNFVHVYLLYTCDDFYFSLIFVFFFLKK